MIIGGSLQSWKLGSGFWGFVFVQPWELEGISNIWKIIIESQNSEVQQKAIKFLVELYHNLAPSIDESKKNK